MSVARPIPHCPSAGRGRFHAFRNHGLKVRLLSGVIDRHALLRSHPQKPEKHGYLMGVFLSFTGFRHFACLTGYLDGHQITATHRNFAEFMFLGVRLVSGTGGLGAFSVSGCV